eukprot:CAMPEP_0113832094 /NCGR_PEP_ID=MMETSP0328-20130328/7196_1 /TAXON_ID=39455 /ORGANISM="Alexandrium minutum" /LENGTH=66 /DNA_ID=CAMNT_0000800285 /DNA_START=108 /DNA_END=304 /DNA_ORIENTATION=+ /assembly_acc=CAM_ASM_000350
MCQPEQAALSKLRSDTTSTRCRLGKPEGSRPAAAEGAVRGLGGPNALLSEGARAFRVAPLPHIPVG